MRKGPAARGQVVLVLQGGGALGAYQAGVYEALCGAGFEPDWVIGTSIGAINASLIAGNAPKDRLPRLREFWRRVQHDSAFSRFMTFARGIPAFFEPRPFAWTNVQARVGLDAASYYTTEPLRETLSSLIDLEASVARRCASPSAPSTCARAGCATSTAATSAWESST